MSGVGLGVAGAALSFPLFRYVGFDSLAGETAFLASTAMSGISAITALMGAYKLSSIAINKLSQALDPIADRIDNSVKNFKERFNGFWSAGDLIENRKNMTREEKAYNSLFYQRELFDAENYSALRGFRDKIADEASKNKGASYADKKAAIFINELRSFTDKIKTAEEEYKYLGELFSKEINNYDKADWNAHPLARDLLQATGVISSRFAPGSSDSFENEIGKTEALSGFDSLYNALHQITPEKRELLNLMSKGFFPSIFKDSQARGFDPDGELKKLETEKNADGHYASSEKIREIREKMTARIDGFTNKADHDAFLESKIDIKNILEAVNKSPRVDIAPDAIDKLTAYREVFDKAINFLEENCKEANQADLVRALKTFNENIKVSGSKENMEKALENLQKEHLENINSFEYSVRNSKTGSMLMSDAAFLLK